MSEKLSNEELVALAEVAAEYGGMYISHMRSEGNQLLEAVDELIEIARRAGIAAEIYHLKAAGEENWDKLEQVVEKVATARGQGLEKKKTFLGLTLETQRDMVLLLVEEHRARHILETVGKAGEFDTSPGTGIAFQIDVEDAVGVAHQVQSITPSLEEEL